MNKNYDVHDKEFFENFQNTIKNYIIEENWNLSAKSDKYKIWSIPQKNSPFNKLFSIVNFDVSPEEAFEFFCCKGNLVFINFLEFQHLKDTYGEKRVEIESFNKNTSLIYCKLIN
jgi:hypothetical protein